jgi:hypothetical protein
MVMMEKLRTMDEELLEAERWIDDDYEMISQFYTAKRMYPNIPFYLQDENGDNYVFGWELIFQYIAKLTQGDYYPDW